MAYQHEKACEDTIPVINMIWSNLKEHELKLFGRFLGIYLADGDQILLKGGLGAGKTTLTREIIRARVNSDDSDQIETFEVPSPSFTIVQDYSPEEGISLPIRHIDFYRLSDPSEVNELDIDHKNGAQIIEWPEKGIFKFRENGLTISFSENSDQTRILSVIAKGSWCKRIVRLSQTWNFVKECQKEGFLDIESIRISHLKGDASGRRYARLKRPERSIILMDSPMSEDIELDASQSALKAYKQTARLHDDIAVFLDVADILRSRGLRTPEIVTADTENGFALIEDLGNQGIIFKSADGTASPIQESYLEAIKTLAKDHNAPLSETILAFMEPYDEDPLEAEIAVFLEWYADKEVKESLTKNFINLWKPLIKKVATLRQAIVMRDVHSPNILMTQQQEVAFIDFQDALIGGWAYDVVSLIQDARVTISKPLQDELLEAYCAHRSEFSDKERKIFEEHYAIYGAQRATKILGVFARLHKLLGREEYLVHVPRVKNYLKQNLSHPAFSELAPIYEQLL